MKRPGPSPGRLRALGAVVVLIALAGLAPFAHGASSWVQGQARTDRDLGIRDLSVALDSGSAVSSTAPGGWYVLDGLLAGSRDRVRIEGSAIETLYGPLFFGGPGPVLGQRVLLLERTTLDEWAKIPEIDPDGTLDDTLGIAFGRVEDAAGLPVVGATVEISPPNGRIFYFGADGSPDPLATGTDATGRYLVVDMPPGPILVDALVGAVPLGRAYGKAVADAQSGLSIGPFVDVAGGVVDETGVAVAGATIAWGFDAGISGVSDGAGAFAVKGLARGLDVSLRGTAAGYRPALGFRHADGEIPDLSSLRLEFVSAASYSSWPAAFGVVQAPTLGMIVGRVLGRDGQTPLAGATVTSDPDVGSATRYFDGNGNPAPGLTQTSATGLFVLFNVPVGTVILSAVAPGETIRSAAAPTEPGAVTTGDLAGMRTITVSGRIQDELFDASSTGGAVVSVVEYPYLAALYEPDGDGTYAFTLSGVPAGEYVTFKVGRSDFKDSYSFLRKAPMSDRPCVLDTREDCQDLFVISSRGYDNLYVEAKSSANRDFGLVSAGIKLANKLGALGLEVVLSGGTGAARYLSDNKFGKTFISTVGAAQLLNASPGVSGFVVFDQRNDEATLDLVRIFADSVVLTSKVRLDCDPDVDGTFANVYPCNGAKLTAFAKRGAFFQWNLGPNVRGQVQFSTDPAFAAVEVTSATSDSKFLNRSWYQATGKKWKRVLNLGTTGSPVYWRVLGRDEDKNETTTAPYVFYLP